MVSISQTIIFLIGAILPLTLRYRQTGKGVSREMGDFGTLYFGEEASSGKAET
jgi:hypothetical protein